MPNGGNMNNKSRHWTFIVYPESAPSNWIDLIQQTGIPFCISPLHDQDKNPDDTIKKEHYHVLVSFDGPTTYKNIVSTFTEPLNSPIPKRVISVRGMYRYFCHLDNPEKHQYDVNKVQCFNSFEIDPTESELVLIKANIISDIDKYQILNYCDLVDHYLESGEYSYFRVVSGNTYFFSAYIRSQNNRLVKPDE